MINILFRADSSSMIGTGHIMRDLVLASEYSRAGANVIFATQDLNGNINYKILEDEYKLEILISNDINELIKLIKKLKIDLLVIDHYDIDFKYEKKLKNKVDIKILSFDDTYEKHYCDILLNHNIGADKKRYKELVPENCKLKCGSKYTLIRDEFRKITINKRSIKNKKYITVFVAMGSSDSQNINIQILKILSKFENLQINLATTSSNINLAKLKRYTHIKKKIKIYIDSKNIAHIINQADFAIIPPSVISTEVIYMKLPFIAIKTTNNQNYVYDFLKAKKFFVLDFLKINKLKYFVKKILADQEYVKIKYRIKTIKIKR